MSLNDLTFSLTMNGVPLTCQQCARVLPDTGQCTNCGADHSMLTASNVQSFIDKVKQLVVFPGSNKQRLSLGSLSLIVSRTGQSYVLNNPVMTIGRNQDSGIALTGDVAVSRQHACIMFVKGGFWLEDLGSTNGSFLNSKRISSKRQLLPGDQIVIGQTNFTVQLTGQNGSPFPNYEIISEVGRGGMGVVYKAIDLRDKQTVAIKSLVLANLEPARRTARCQRFQREAMLVSRLRHPNIISLLEVKLGPSDFYYVMEFLSGKSLRLERESRGGCLSLLYYLPIFKQVASALSYAHGQSIVHRDVKPDNIFILPDGKVKLTDFGIARLMEDFEDSKLTKSGAVLGTLSYSAPEQLNDAKKVDQRADIFSLATVTYEALSGINPFQGHGITDTVVQVASGEARALHEINPGIGADLSAVIAKAMAKKASKRYSTVAEFAQEFELCIK